MRAAADRSLAGDAGRLPRHRRVVSTDLTVLVSGESGTGKELVARAIHDLGARRSAPFVAINMAAIPRELIEAELFGHERGAFTGAAQRTPAVSNRPRRHAVPRRDRRHADGGADASAARAAVGRVHHGRRRSDDPGRRAHRRCDQSRPAQQVASGQFREDLFYRLNVVPIALPALRDRRQDIALLARHFLDSAAAQGLPRRQLQPDGGSRARGL